MFHDLRALLAALALLASTCASDPRPTAVEHAGAAPSATLAAPRARVQTAILASNGHERFDDYYWLRERENPEVIAYLEAENDYTSAVMAHTEGLQETLFEELKGRVRQDDSSAPYELRGHWYYTRFEEGRPYPIHCRRAGSMDAPEQVLLDVNVLAEGHGYYSVGAREVHPRGRVLAYAVDDIGRRIHTVHFKDLTTGEELGDRIPNVTSNIEWAEDGRTLLYARQDPVTLRSYQIWRHALGTDPEQDVLVYEEPDETFRCFVSKTKSREYLIIASTQTLAAEYRYLPADAPDGEPRVFLPRERGHEYRLDHLGDHFYVRTNKGAENFRLVRAPVTDPERWEELVPARDDVLLQSVELFTDYMVLNERREGLVRLRVVPWALLHAQESGEHEIDFGEPTYRAGLRDNHEIDTHILRYSYSSMTTPDSIFDYDMRTRERTLRKREEVLGGFDPADYVTERLWATAGDGTRVPISIVCAKRARADGPPCLLYGYGSYGASMDASFSADRLSLLDRGFAYAIAHVRGGQELGRAWYEDGKLFNKRNTFSDFVACAEHLVETGYADPERLYCMGGSAGGLLIGAVLNLRPALFHGAVAAVPFVDVVTTMLDDTIPLTTSEYDEWGDPREPRYYEYMLSYSPYDRVEAREYPHLLVTTGLHDSQVQYWEPAKWVAKLRATKSDANRLLLKTEMEAGHGGRSGRFERYRHTAFVYAFLLDLAGGAR